MSDPLAQPLRLPCGAVLPNRLCKAAMTEGVADALLRATSRHETLYRAWSEGGAGLLLTGNVQIDRDDLERPGNVAIDISDPRTTSPEARERLAAWARAGTTAGNHLWMQISHAGRQSPWYVTRRPRAPSAVQLQLLGNYARPVPLTEDEIVELIGRFAAAAVVARETGFTGVQVHGAHGYLISSFLSPVTNRRTDAWGGSLENRARFLLETVRAVRRAVGADFPVALKLNSDDFRKGGFSHAECLEVVRWLNDESLDLLEISGGTYEQPRSDRRRGPRRGCRGRAAEHPGARGVFPRLCRRDPQGGADAADGHRRISHAGRDGSRAGSGDCDMIGIGRPLCWQPDFPRRLLSREVDGIERIEDRLKFAERGWRSPASPLLPVKVLNTFGAQSWYYCQLFRLADGQPADLERGILSTLVEYLGDELRTARRLAGAGGRIRRI